MDNCFDFEGTTNSTPHQRGRPTRNQEVGVQDMNMMRGDFANDEASFQSLQHFVEGLTSSSNSPEYIQAAHTPEAGGKTSDDFHDFSRWIDGARLSARLCDYCQSKGLQCLVIQRDTAQVTSCTSCHALSQPCSLSQGPRLSNLADTAASFDRPVLGRATSNLRGQLKFNETTDSYEGESSTSKVGARFSREAVRVLKQWLSAHHQHPYPTDDEKEQLKRQTGLNKTQITNWLANARRRGKVRAPGSKSPASSSQAVDIPVRKTPASEHIPLERWKNSPPESEPASVSAIAKAVRTTSLKSDGDSLYSFARTEETSSLARASSTSSLETSQSSGHSFASAFSRQSRGGSFGTIGKGGRRRRRRQAPRPVDSHSMSAPRQFQCTFCVESFRTKHDWQRHEKSLHLSLERWVCSASGGTSMCRDKREMSCVFCGFARPDASHLEMHNYSSCLERELAERTFYRKDHLRQHLRLVHGCKFNPWSMELWRATIPDVKSTCGFCGLKMTTWQKRADHLAEHFKSGKSMADWRGDWGFEKQIMALVESATPPNMLRQERTNQIASAAPNSMHDTKRNTDISTPSSYELVKIGLIEYIHSQAALGHFPSNTELHYESVRLVFGTPSEPKLPTELRESWFHDLILFSDNDGWLEPFRLFTGGKQPLGSEDELERELLEYVRTQRTLGILASTPDLQAQACEIIARKEAMAIIPCPSAASWFCHLARASHTWLEKFKIRAGLRFLPEPSNTVYSVAPNTVFSKLESQLAAFVNMQVSLGVIPTDAELQAQARWITFGSYDSWNHTAADNEDWLERFKLQRGLKTEMSNYIVYPTTTSQSMSSSIPVSSWQNQPLPFNSPGNVPTTAVPYQNPPSDPNFTTPFLARASPSHHDFESALSQYVQTITSPNNPNRHIPSDDELREQSRWIIYNNIHDPYNQPTPADDPEWLLHFKRSQESSLTPQTPLALQLNRSRRT